MLSDDVQHSNQQANPLYIEDASVVKDTEQLLELLLVLLESAFHELFVIEVGQTIDKSGTFFAVTLHN